MRLRVFNPIGQRFLLALLPAALREPALEARDPDFRVLLTAPLAASASPRMTTASDPQPCASHQPPCARPCFRAPRPPAACARRRRTSSRQPDGNRGSPICEIPQRICSFHRICASRCSRPSVIRPSRLSTIRRWPCAPRCSCGSHQTRTRHHPPAMGRPRHLTSRCPSRHPSYRRQRRHLLAPPSSTSSSMRSSVPSSPRAMLWCLLVRRDSSQQSCPRLVSASCVRAWLLIVCAATLGGCSGQRAPAAPAGPRGVVLITIDTLRADRVGAYGYALRGRRRSTRSRAAARDSTAPTRPRPITLPSHASLMTGRYPPGHGARHNGMRVERRRAAARGSLRDGRASRPARSSRAFPLDRRFGLDRGFQTYGDRMPRAGGGSRTNVPGQQVVDEALTWLRRHRGGSDSSSGSTCSSRTRRTARRRTRALPARAMTMRSRRRTGRSGRLLGRARRGRRVDPGRPRSGSRRSVRRARRNRAQHLRLRHDAARAADRRRPGDRCRESWTRRCRWSTSRRPLARLLGLAAVRCRRRRSEPALARCIALPARTLYAESFAPLLDFGWSPLRSVRQAAGNSSRRRARSSIRWPTDAGEDARSRGGGTGAG